MKPFVVVSVLLILLSAAGIGRPSPAVGAAFRSAGEAFRAAVGTDSLAPGAKAWLLRRAGLEWTVTYGHNRGGYGVHAVASPGFRYCILTWIAPSADARYCLIDSTGRVLWTRTGEPWAGPAVAANGVAALISHGGRPGLPGRPNSLRIDFVDRDGRHLGSTSWGNRILHRGPPDPAGGVYAFSPDGRQFLVAVNEPIRDTSFVADGQLYAVAPDGTIRWRREFDGRVRLDGLSFSAEGDRIMLTGTLGVVALHGKRQVFVLSCDSAGQEIERHVLPGPPGVAPRPDGAVRSPR